MPAIPTEETPKSIPVLQPGNYQIISAVSDRIFLSRSPAEDRSLLPKPVLSLPPGVTLAPWKVSRNADGTYTLENNYAPVVEIKGQLFAQLQPGQPRADTRWRITSVHWQGRDQFIIENADRTEGWSLRMTDGGSVVPFVQPNVLPLVATRSLPPQYPPFERFIFKRI
ncbi:hypothetical protein H072_9870 [Dactylellina haptotyla CBS 200.50]|uniref:Ricin B lectin domain-containing protein n=1 Tax=Dactylellina haptotyla (strain CBS 200.50) TaxID=1284197 RepID=S8BBR0_DACHA|nr:hypothetical protein H072_9870 [Dactylellina haptotyla CBS 200.50]